MGKMYRILVGRHHERKNPNEKGITYKAGENDIFESEKDMLKKNGIGGIAKFEEVAGSTQTVQNPWMRMDGETAKQFAERMRRLADEAEKTAEEESKQAHTKTEETGTPYEDMTIDELKKLANEEEINIKGARTKDEIIKMIREITEG